MPIILYIIIVFAWAEVSNGNPLHTICFNKPKSKLMVNHDSSSLTICSQNIPKNYDIL